LKSKSKQKLKTAIDVNVGHFSYTEGQVKTLPHNLKTLYERIKHYQRLLARKRKTNGKKAAQSNNYVEPKTKLRRDYRKVANTQHDIVQKFTTELVNNYDEIVIEDLDVKRMQNVASKGLQRSLFGCFRQVLAYKYQWYGKELFLAAKFYPGTQRCSRCGFVKTGDDKIGHEFVGFDIRK